MTQSLYLKHMRALKQLEDEARRLEPGLRLLATMLNSSLETRLSKGTHTEQDIQMLEDAEARRTNR